MLEDSVPEQAGTRPWQREMAGAIRSPGELLALLGLDPERMGLGAEAQRDFPLRVPRGYAARMRPGDPGDPLLLQVLPLASESEPVPGFTADPVGDLAAMEAPGLLHKYQGRVLLVVTGACAVHCRYCFRRHFPYGEANPAGGHWAESLAYIAAHPEIDEVILSGGDPLSLPDRRLAGMAGELAAFPHLKRLRIHTRLPVVLPGRVDDYLVRWLSRLARSTALKPVVVIHANHPNEIDGAVAGAMRRLAGAGAVLFNQAVLLRGVNDDPETLAALSEALFAAGVLPYYLHRLDRVRGAAHFEVPDAEAEGIMTALRTRLPGYLVPKFVREEPGAPYKRPL
ncbi:MAG: EF-P beta-lysylation protein EpmB [bacterium]